jgi:hypothetical protein
MMSSIKLFGQLQKAEKQDDGTLIVSGIASSEAVDGDGERIKASAIKAALPDYMAFGAVREMHQPIAAGVALKCEVQPDGKTYIEAKIVDPVTIQKVEAGVLQGFSVGGKVTGRDSLDKSIITGISLTEISLVDRPCNPEARVSLCKMEDGEEDKDKGKDKDKDKGKGEGEESEPESDPEKDEDKDDDEAEKLAKVSKAYDGALSKILSLEARLQKTEGELASLRKQAAPPKAAVMAISKGEDTGAPDMESTLQKQAAAFPGMSQAQQAATLVQIIHKAR